jgi:hypothetical protein
LKGDKLPKKKMTIVHEEKSTKQNKTTTSNLQEKQKETKHVKKPKKCYDNEDKGKKKHVKRDKPFAQG